MQITIDDATKERLRAQCDRRSSPTHHEFSFSYAKDLIRAGLDAAERETDEQILAELAAKKRRLEARAAGVSVSALQSHLQAATAPSLPVPASLATKPSATLPAPSKAVPELAPLDADELVRQANAARGHAK
jgi:hypothetical protein